MKYILMLITLIFLSSCSSKFSKNNNTGLNIDIYQYDMTYEKFKQYVIEYAEKSTYPSLTNNNE
tara:strand:- start:255 stop:446 length:192 start_codon:yes stop_codon:yes gene_type:complete